MIYGVLKTLKLRNYAQLSLSIASQGTNSQTITLIQGDAKLIKCARTVFCCVMMGIQMKYLGLGLATAIGLLATPALAQSASTGPAPISTLLVLIGSFLVMWMAAGFCMLEAGFVRAKNTAMQLAKNLGVFAFASIGFWFIGYSLAFPWGDWFVAGFLSDFTSFIAATGTYEGARPVAPNIEVADGAFFLFQLMFCVATASIVSGAVAERVKLWPFLIFTLILTSLIYPIQASWTWGGGFLAQLGFLDRAGSVVVHSVGGWAALAGVIVLGPRIGKFHEGRIQPMPASNLPLATLGVFALWLGWFGFNGASHFAAGTFDDIAAVSRIFANTSMAGAGGLAAAFIMTQIIFGRVDLTMVLNGALAGLVSITAESLTPSLGLSLLIGGVGGTIVVLAVPLMDRFGLDDVVGAIPVHLLAGIWGGIAVVLSNPDASIASQLLGIAVIGVVVLPISFFFWTILRLTMGVRPSVEAEIDGLDLSELAMEAYPDFVVQDS